MANPEILESLKKGRNGLIQWILNNLSERVDLSDANLEFLDLSNLNLNEANLQGANLRHSDLRGSSFWKANLENSNLEGADLRYTNLLQTNLKKANLEEANLKYVNLSEANLHEANLRKCEIEKCDMRSCNLEKAVLSRVIFINVVLSGANLSHANLAGVEFRNCSMWMIILDGVDLRWTKGYILDDASIKDTRFSPRSNDPWSELRRKYTGPKLILHIIFLIIFILPFIFRAFVWNNINILEKRMEILLKNIEYKIEQKEDFNNYTEKMFAKYLYQELQESKTEAIKNNREYNMATLILGLNNDKYLFFLTIILIIYNITRGCLTFYIYTLREEEDRNHIAPSTEYYLKYKPFLFIPYKFEKIHTNKKN